MFKTLLTALPLVVAMGSAEAYTIPAGALTVDANDFTGIQTPPFDYLPMGAAVNLAYIDNGVNFSEWNQEGVYDDWTSNAICGINLDGVCDLLTDVDGQIVMPGTTHLGLTNYLLVELGITHVLGSLFVEIFDVNHDSLGVFTNTTTETGPHGRSVIEINRRSHDIVSFLITGTDPFGVNMIVLGAPIAKPSVSAVPLPAALPLLGAALGVLGFGARRRRKSA